MLKIIFMMCMVLLYVESCPKQCMCSLDKTTC